MEASHERVQVNTHNTPVRTSVWRLWVAQSTSTARAPPHNPREAEVQHGSGAVVETSSCSCYDNLTTLTSEQQPAMSGEPAAIEAASALEPAAESPVETAEDDIADKAEEPNTDEIKVKESAALDPTKRRLALWNKSTSSRAQRSPCPRKALQGVTCRNIIIH